MKLRYFFLLPIVVLVACSRSVPPLGTLKMEAMKLIELSQTKNYEEYTDMIYPTLIKAAGGRREFIEDFRQLNRAAAEHDLKVLGIDVGEPGDAVVSDGKIFVFIQTVTRIDTPAATIKRNGYLLAISSDNGATWKFLIGDKLTALSTYRLVPGLPSRLKFPKDESPVVINKPTPEPPAPPSRSALEINAIAAANALTEGYYHEYVAALYPPMVAGLGGPDKAAAFFEGRVRANVAAGRRIVSSVEIDEPGESATQGHRIFSVVPATYKGENAKQRSVRHTALLAISEDGGANWTFIFGITPKMAASLTTLSLPPDLKIPDSQPEIVTDK